MTTQITTKTDNNRDIAAESKAEEQPVFILPLGGTLRSKEGGPPLNESTLYGRLLARYEFRLDESGVSVRLHDRDDPQARAIEVAFDPAQPDEVLWVHSYPNAPFSQIVYGAAAHLWLTSVPAAPHPIGEPQGGQGCLPSLSLCPEDVRLRQALHAYRDMRAMEDAAHLRSACRAEAQAKKAEMRARLWGLGRFTGGGLPSLPRFFFAREE